MKRVLLACLGAVCLLTASAFADEGLPSNSVLNDMGLSGMQIMSDTDALAVRGMGWIGDDHGGPSTKPWVMVSGHSYASIPGGTWEPNGHDDNGGGTRTIGIARSENWYQAAGKYYASGGNESVAMYTHEHTVHTTVGDRSAIMKTVNSYQYFAGGSSYGKAF